MPTGLYLNYLSGFVSEVVMCREKRPESNIEPIFKMIKDNYQAYINIKNSKKAYSHLLCYPV